MVRPIQLLYWLLGCTLWTGVSGLEIQAQPSNRMLSQYVHRGWTERSGLPYSVVWSIEQTPDGYLWLGTRGGLTRYDGARFRHFTVANTPQLTSNEIRELFVDSSGVLWIGTYGGGLVRYADGTFAQVTAPDGQLSSIIWSITEHPFRDGSIWVGTDKGVNRFEGGAWSTIELPGAAGSDVRDMAFDNSGALWLGLYGRGLARYAEGTATVYPIDPAMADPWLHTVQPTPDKGVLIGLGQGQMDVSDRQLLTFQNGTYGTRPAGFSQSTASIRSLHQGADRKLWIGTYGSGLYLVGPRGTERFGIEHGLTDNRVQDVFEDHAGNVWIGTMGGLNVLTDRSALITFGEEEGLPHPNARSVMGTDDGVLWVSTANGVARMQGEDVRALTVADGLPEEFVHSVYAEADGLTWFGSESFLTRYDGRSFTRFPVSEGGGGVRSIVRDAAGQLWAGVFGGGLLKFSPEGSQLYDVEDGLANANISVLAVDRDNRLWIGTMGGISVFDGTAFSTIDADDGLVGYHVRCFYQDDRGDMWAGTVGHGLFRVARDGSISEVSTENGLYDDGVWSLVPDTDGNVWMSSDRGVSRVALADLQAVADGTQQMLIPASFNQADGMRTSEANGSSKPSGWRMPDGRLWFVTQKGVVAIDPAYLPHVPVQPLIERVVTRRSETNGPALGLRHVLDGRDVEIEFSAISLLHADRVRFRYRLKGYDDWRTSQNRRVEYTNLPPGTYTFEVEAALGPEAWRGQAASQTLVVSRKFYETWWFVLVSVFTGSALIAAGYWLQRKHERSRQHLLEARIADRTKELRAERDKTAAIAQRLVEIDRYKTEFFTNMSHEFRTPLTLTIGPLEEALREEGPHVPTTVRRSMNMALRNARRLLRLITQLLDLARIETGALRLRASREDLAGLAHDLVLSFAPLGERKGLHFTINRPDDPVFAYVARDQMEQLLMNLLSNAIKFTPAGGAVTVSVAENPGTVVVEVRDTGVGMAEHELARVFDRFYRAEPRAHATSEDTIGSGIGLALVRDLAELHYATLDIESEVDQGTTVRLLLQAGSDHLSPAEIVDVETSDGSVRRLDVDPLPEDVQTHTAGTGDQPVLLIVDDHPDIREYVRAGFEPAYRVLEAKDGADGLQAIREHLPDIILSDVMMPRMDGVELCEAVRADAELSFLPIILLTAKASAEDAARGLKAEADDYVTKPFDMALLRARVANLIRSRKRLHERLAHLPAAEPTVSLAHTEAEVRFLDTIQALVRERLDDETYSVDDLAHSVGQSRRTLYRRLKQLTGETPHAFIQRLRIERACVLLKTENATVSEIAYAVGFRSVSHFSQVFRHQLGRSPTAYRTS